MRGYASAMATADQHDTLVLRHDTLVLPRPPAPGAPLPTAAHPHVRAGWQMVGEPPAPAPWDARGWSPAAVPGASAWSQVPPFLTPVAPPVLVMRNNAAVIGATLGSVALFVSLIPLIGIIAWVLAPIGLLSSGIGGLVGASRRVGRVAAVWGLLTSAGALFVCMAWAALILAL
jgi:hypothetical protein